MGQLRTAKRGDQGAFPGSQQVATGLIPTAQCIQATFRGFDGNVRGVPTPRMDKLAPPDWIVNQHAGKALYYQDINTGFWRTNPIVANSANRLNLLFAPPGPSNPSPYFIDDGPAHETQQDAQSFMRDALEAGHAATMKGGQVYTDMPLAPHNQSCYILSNPQ